MTDDSCGCPCRDCREQDNHRCGLDTCGYTKYLRARREKPKPVPTGDLRETLRLAVRQPWKRFKDKAARERITEWARFVEETAALDYDTRTERRRVKWREMYG